MPYPRSAPSHHLVEVVRLGTDSLMLARTVFKIGDLVKVLNVPHSSAFDGHIIDISSSEVGYICSSLLILQVMFQRGDGTKTHIHFSQLAQGQQQLAHLAELHEQLHQPAVLHSRPRN